MTLINYKISDFEGPLDLLLVLLSQNKMSIADIEIITIINQYLAVIDANRDTDLEQASEFIDMAARLIHMKSVFLLPKDNEGEKLKAELQGQLIEYSRAKKAAGLLRQRFIGDRLYTRPARESTIDYTYDIVHRIETLTNAYSKLSDRDLRRVRPAQEKFDPIVNAPVVPVSAKIFTVMKGIARNNFRTIYDAFSNMKSKSEAVATFLALLELIRAHRVTVGENGDIELSRKGKRQ